MKRRPPKVAPWFSPTEEAQLRRLVDQAFDLRETPYFRDAVDAIERWHEQTLPDRLERKARAEP